MSDTPDTAVATKRESEVPIYKLADIGTGRVLAAQAFLPEDEFAPYYAGGSSRNTGAIIPPYDFKTLDRLCLENNALSPCIEAMVTNVDGTGYTFTLDTPDSENIATPEDDSKIKELEDFFKETWPGESFMSQRKKLRRDIKRIGNGYLEVIRNLRDEVIFIKNVDGKMVRLVKLEDAVTHRTKILRRGVEVSVTVARRWRKFVQLVNGRQILFFKEFGCPLDLNKNTGEWASAGERVSPQLRSTEMLHFIDLPDASSPYGVPCWVGQLPSVLGSRKAEEFNLGFFDSGGVPPVMIMLQGGVLSHKTRQALEQKASFGTAMSKNRVLIIEMEPTGGTIDSTANTKIMIERFGGDRQTDSFFEKYDERAEERVRRAFRLPALFVGMAQHLSFATAFAAYTVAEAQVFRPDRDSFDEVMNVKVLPAMGYDAYRMKSKPLVIEDATLRLQGIEIGQATAQVDAAVLLNEINATVGTRLKVSESLPIPQEQVAGPTISAVPGGSGVATSGKAGIRVKPSTAPAAKTVKSKPKGTPIRNPKVTKEDDADEADFLEAMPLSAEPKQSDD